MSEEEIKLIQRCKRCNKPLKNEKSQKEGYGRMCLKLMKCV
ncbi:MAG TPA: DUF6011 domain-containing protein [Methanosarcina sp.]